MLDDLSVDGAQWTAYKLTRLLRYLNVIDADQWSNFSEHAWAVRYLNQAQSSQQRRVIG
jgi:hypothetical protein